MVWRPAMHYRWFYEEGARFASGHLAREVLSGLYLPLLVKRAKRLSTALAVTERDRDLGPSLGSQ